MHLTKTSGGFRAEVLLERWAPGALVTVFFGSPSLHAARTSHATIDLARTRLGKLAFVLAPEAGPSNAFMVDLQGALDGSTDEMPVQLTCSIQQQPPPLGSMAAAPAAGTMPYPLAAAAASYPSGVHGPTQARTPAGRPLVAGLGGGKLVQSSAGANGPMMAGVKSIRLPPLAAGGDEPTGEDDESSIASYVAAFGVAAFFFCCVKSLSRLDPARMLRSLKESIAVARGHPPMPHTGADEDDTEMITGGGWQGGRGQAGMGAEGDDDGEAIELMVDTEVRDAYM